MFKLYGIANCDTVKKARKFLDSNKKEYEFIDFKKSPPSIEDLKRWKKSFGDFPINKMGTTYKKLKDEYESLSDELKLQFIQNNSSMIKRPILEKNDKVMAFGFNEAEYKK